jgi:hypothetical protein
MDWISREKETDATADANISVQQRHESNLLALSGVALTDLTSRNGLECYDVRRISLI